jgi:aldehyde:ferredoxin oxidoreductase
MLKKVVKRIRLLQRGYDYLCGLRREEETMPDSAFQPIKTRQFGTRKMMQRQDQEKMKADYYELSGCDPATGAPRREALGKLGLEDLADKLDKLELKRR